MLSTNPYGKPKTLPTSLITILALSFPKVIICATLFLYFDVRYLIHAPKDSCIQKNHESVEMRWMDFDELIQITSDDSTLRLAKVAFEIANEQFGVGNVS